MELLHFSAINEAYHKGILRSWEEGGCLQEITDRMGYRLALISADFNEQVRPGGLLKLTVNINNSGFAALMNPRPLFIVLKGSDLPVLTKLELDPRTWQPGDSSFTVSIRLPSKIKDGDYQLALWLPDEAETLQSNPLYAVQFANEGVWDESTGYNTLGQVSIDSSLTGSYERGDSMQVEEISIHTATPSDSSAANSPSGDLIFNPQISNDAETIQLSFDYASGQHNAFQLFIDTDQNSGTGFAVNGIGAEELFENHTWNIYDGSGSDWKWQPTEVLINFTDTGSHVGWNISRELLKATQFDIVFQIVDMNWDTVSTTQKNSYTIK
jgi:hypothetical protein